MARLMPRNKPTNPSFQRDVTLDIGGYDDLFSDFDPRPYTQKAISDDFMSVLNKLIIEDDEHIRTLRFQVPREGRNHEIEHTISARMEHDFTRIHGKVSRDLRSVYSGGALKAIIGMLALMGALSVTSFNLAALWRNLCLVILEPAGWFFVWTGFEESIYGSKPLKLKRDFYAQLKRCKIEFVSTPV